MDELVARMAVQAAEQHGLVTSKQAEAILGASRAARWLRSGRLIRLQPNALRMAGAPESWYQHLRAAQLSAGGVISHRAAAELWGLIDPAGYVEVSVPVARRPTLWPPALLHRIKDLHVELAVEREQLVITDPVRTLVDLGLVLPTWSVSRALTRAVGTNLVSADQVQELREALGRPGRNGTGVIGTILERRAATIGGEESELESRFVALLRAHEVPSPVLQHEVWVRGRFVARIDAAYPDRKIAFELDGYSSHADLEAFQRDRTRQNELIRLGWLVQRYTWADVTHRGPQTAAEVRKLLQRSAA